LASSNHPSSPLVLTMAKIDGGGNVAPHGGGNTGFSWTC